MISPKYLYASISTSTSHEQRPSRASRWLTNSVRRRIRQQCNLFAPCRKQVQSRKLRSERPILQKVFLHPRRIIESRRQAQRRLEESVLGISYASYDAGSDVDVLRLQDRLAPLATIPGRHTPIAAKYINRQKCVGNWRRVHSVVRRRPCRLSGLKPVNPNSNRKNRIVMAHPAFLFCPGVRRDNLCTTDY